MNDALAVRGRQRRGGLGRNLDGLGDIERPDTIEASREALALEELHQHVGNVVLGQHADVDDVDDVGVADGVGRARLVEEA